MGLEFYREVVVVDRDAARVLKPDDGASAQQTAVRVGGDVEHDEIVTHPGGSLFSGNDIKRAVQTGQAPIGERLLSAHANENPLFGVDSIPFLATSFEESDKLWKAAKDSVKQIILRGIGATDGLQGR